VVRVIDVNDNYPIASVNTLDGATSGSVNTETSASVPENSDVGSFVAHLSVYDADTGPSGQVSSHRNLYGDCCCNCRCDYIEFLNGKTMLAKILLTYTTKLNVAFFGLMRLTN